MEAGLGSTSSMQLSLSDGFSCASSVGGVAELPSTPPIPDWCEMVDSEGEKEIEKLRVRETEACQVHESSGAGNPHAAHIEPDQHDVDFVAVKGRKAGKLKGSARHIVRVAA